MGRWTLTVAGAALALAASGAGAAPATAPTTAADWLRSIHAIPAPAMETIPLPVSRPRPSAPSPEGWASDGRQRMVYDVAEPVLVPTAPPPGAAPGDVRPTVILAPGGGFEFLSIDNEGFGVAERLRALGVRVFILEYRTLPLAGGLDGFKAAVAATFTGRPLPGGGTIEQDVPDAVADAQAALRMVRRRAREWGVDSARVGLVGFSAGAVTTLATAEADAPDARPDFIAMIYGPTKTAPVPPHAPPLFAALAANDPFFGRDDLGLIDAWRRSGASVELHLFDAGGHGFASQPNGTTSDGWCDAFARWLRANGFTPRAA